MTNATTINIPHDGESIESIVIGTKEEIAANNADTISIEEIEKWARGELEDISQIARDRIRAVIIETETGIKQLITPGQIIDLTRFKIFRVIFNAGQKPQFTIGSYESLAAVQRKLDSSATVEVTAQEAALEPAPA